jgi:hypothetical protein
MFVVPVQVSDIRSRTPDRGTHTYCPLGADRARLRAAENDAAATIQLEHRIGVRASSTTSAYVPIGRVSQPPSSAVRCG